MPAYRAPRNTRSGVTRAAPAVTEAEEAVACPAARPPGCGGGAATGRGPAGETSGCGARCGSRRRMPPCRSRYRLGRARLEELPLLLAPGPHHAVPLNAGKADRFARLTAAQLAAGRSVSLTGGCSGAGGSARPFCRGDRVRQSLLCSPPSGSVVSLGRKPATARSKRSRCAERAARGRRVGLVDPGRRRGQAAQRLAASVLASANAATILSAIDRAMQI